jgi:hypothetical protein
MVDYSEVNSLNYVMLELARRASTDTPGESIAENRIGLLCQTVDITTNKQSLSFPVPFSGIISGESKTIAMDLGLATKTVSLTGTILDQFITKNDSKGVLEQVKLSAYEIAQLLHSYVDSSFLHEDQNLSKLIILIPSRADKNFVQRTSPSNSATADLTELPLTPFTWANRPYDVPSLSIGESEYPLDFDAVGDELDGITGYIDTFSTSFSGTEVPQITFNMSFQQASSAASDFINASL